VINHDLPMVAEDYVHRIGRTGRNGAQGEALSLVSPEEAGLLRQIQRVLKQDIEMRVVEGYAPSKPLQMNGSVAAARRPTNQPPRGQQHARRPHASAPRSTHAHAGPKQRTGGAPRGHGGGRRDHGAR
jgi:ATP-dependent RNA helicase RhlE